MPRFSDEWVIDRVLFDYVAGGSCACCSINSALFLPNGTADLIGAVTDLESDQANAEVAALSNHPWPLELRDQVWSDRVKIRLKLKQEMPKYAEFWNTYNRPIATDTNTTAANSSTTNISFSDWCLANGRTVAQCCQVPRSEILDYVVHEHYGIHSAYKVVLCAVLEQVANFGLTAYESDAPAPHSSSISSKHGNTVEEGDDTGGLLLVRMDDNAEFQFERALQFGRRTGGFSIPLWDSTTESINQDMMRTWLQRFHSLGGPKLFGVRQRGEEEEDDDDSPESEPSKPTPSGPSFQSDRRLLRLLIARYWGDILIKKYLNETQNSAVVVEPV